MELHLSYQLFFKPNAELHPNYAVDISGRFQYPLEMLQIFTGQWFYYYEACTHHYLHICLTDSLHIARVTFVGAAMLLRTVARNIHAPLHVERLYSVPDPGEALHCSMMHLRHHKTHQWLCIIPVHVSCNVATLGIMIFSKCV
jgi:hypothetical protein